MLGRTAEMIKVGLANFINETLSSMNCSGLIARCIQSMNWDFH